ncbi:MAG: hypothetical protein ACI828_002887 [Flavobacteriales bacterium]|jgi:hypothetical protein
MGISEICCDTAVSSITDRADIKAEANKKRSDLNGWKWIGKNVEKKFQGFSSNRCRFNK